LAVPITGLPAAGIIVSVGPPLSARPPSKGSCPKIKLAPDTDGDTLEDDVNSEYDAVKEPTANTSPPVLPCTIEFDTVMEPFVCTAPDEGREVVFPEIVTKFMVAVAESDSA
jgi:hypothetical protein